MSVLVLAEHNNTEIKSSTLNTIGAASQIDQNIEVLLVGNSGNLSWYELHVPVGQNFPVVSLTINKTQ